MTTTTLVTRRSVLTAAAAGLALPLFHSLLNSPAKAAEPARPAHPAGRTVTLLHFTDTHAQLEQHWDYLPGQTPELAMLGGFARLKTAIERERQRSGGACILVDSGDEFQGSAPAAWSKGEVVIEPLNALRPDVYVVGNWDAVYGPEQFMSTMSRLRSKVICYNLHEESSGRGVFPASVTFDRDGVKVAIVGVTDVTASKRQSPTEFRGLDTSRIEGLHEFVRDLKARERPDVLVLVTHTGLTIARQMAREMPELDVVLSAHTHERTEKPIREGNVIVVEPGCFGSFLGRLDLELKPGGGIADCQWQLIPIRPEEFPEDPEVKRLVDESLRPYRERMGEVLGTTAATLMRYDVLETTMDDVITEAIRESTGVDIAVSNGFRFGPPIPAGKVTESDLWNMLPKDARVKRGWVTGRELKEYLERELELVYSRDPWKLSGGWGPRAAGLRVTYRYLAEPGKRVESMQVNGNDVVDDQRYTFGGCEREGEPLDVVCRHPGTHDVRVLDRTAHDCVRAYLRLHPHISVRRDGRATAVDLPPVVFSQDEILPENRRS